MRCSHVAVAACNKQAKPPNA